MKTLPLKYWYRLRSSFWFVPAAMACLAAALAVSAVELDRAVAGDLLQRLGWSYSGGAVGAGLLLGTVVGSMIAIAGSVFSMTLVALSLASSQLGPRLLHGQETVDFGDAQATKKSENATMPRPMSPGIWPCVRANVGKLNVDRKLHAFLLDGSCFDSGAHPGERLEIFQCSPTNPDPLIR
jgi:hypothetical protein